MQLNMKDITVLGQPADVCLNRLPVARDVPLNSIRVSYNNKIGIYSLRFFPDSKRAGSLFYAINSEGKGYTNLNLVSDGTVIAHLWITSPETREFIDLGGFDKAELDKVMHVLVIKNPPNQPPGEK